MTRPGDGGTLRAAERRRLSAKSRGPRYGTLRRDERARERMRALITGGAGFIGCNLARYLASRGHGVHILDSLARPGSERNLAWLRDTLGPALEVTQADIGDQAAVARAAEGADAIFHFA